MSGEQSEKWARRWWRENASEVWVEYSSVNHIRFGQVRVSGVGKGGKTRAGRSTSPRACGGSACSVGFCQPR